MTIEPSLSTVAHLEALARLSAVFARSPRAQVIWTRYHRQTLGDVPMNYLEATDGTVDIEGLVIRGSWDPDIGWDLDSAITVLTEDDEIITLKGWLAAEMVLR